MARLRFLHTADLHLDSPFTGLQGTDDALAGQLCDATFRAFDGLVRTALERRVDFVLVAGDVFDGAERSLRAQVRFRDGLARLAREGIPSYVIHGNHDPLDGWISSIRFPDLVTVFPGDRVRSEVFHRDGQALARIHGISYPRRTVPDDFGRGFAREGPEPLQIGLFHCNVGGDSRHDPYAPRTVEELRATGLDYWALGHIHEARVLSPDAPFVAYPGNPQGRHVREAGPRGALLVETEGPRVVRHETVALDVVRWELLEVDAGGLRTMEALQQRLQEVLEEARDEAAGRSLVARVRLVGRSPLNRELARDLPGLLAVAREAWPPGEPFTWIERLDDQTRPDVDLEERARAEDFVGSVLRLGRELRERPEELAGWLEDLYEHHRLRKRVRTPHPEELRALMDEALSLAADRLLEDE